MSSRYPTHHERAIEASRVHNRIIDMMPRDFGHDSFVKRLVEVHHYDRERAEGCWKRELELRCRAHAVELYEAAKGLQENLWQVLAKIEGTK